MAEEDQTKNPGQPPQPDPPEKPQETQPPEKPQETQPLETKLAPLVVEWEVSLHCEIAFKPVIFIQAWRIRLPSLSPVVDIQASSETKTVFDVVALIEAPNNAKAATMASNLLKRHFQTVNILTVTAEPVKV